MANLKNPVKAIRAKCIECSGSQLSEVANCPIEDCALYPFRFGKNPFRKPMSEERRQALSERQKANNAILNVKKERILS